LAIQICGFRKPADSGESSRGHRFLRPSLLRGDPSKGRLADVSSGDTFGSCCYRNAIIQYMQVSRGAVAGPVTHRSRCPLRAQSDAVDAQREMRRWARSWPSRPQAPALRQLVEKRLRLLQVERVEALGEPAVGRSEKFSGLIPFSLVAPEPRHSGGGAQLPGLCLLRPRY
jgi:hypothetical protein